MLMTDRKLESLLRMALEIEDFDRAAQDSRTLRVSHFGVWRSPMLRFVGYAAAAACLIWMLSRPAGKENTARPDLPRKFFARVPVSLCYSPGVRADGKRVESFQPTCDGGCSL